MQGLFFSLTHKLAILCTPGSVKAESAYLLLFFVPFSFFFMIMAFDYVAETHKNWHKRRKMCPRCCINHEMSLNATKRLCFSVSFQCNSSGSFPLVYNVGTWSGAKTPPTCQRLHINHCLVLGSPYICGKIGARGKNKTSHLSKNHR